MKKQIAAALIVTSILSGCHRTGKPEQPAPTRENPAPDQAEQEQQQQQQRQKEQQAAQEEQRRQEEQAKQQQAQQEAQNPVVGQAVTPIVDHNKNRLNNIKLVMKKLDGVVIPAGGEFSFNQTVGPRTPERGYKKAIIFDEGEKVKEIGGGICQAATTIYQAATAAGLPVTEREQHQQPVDYAPDGNDATVFYGSIDLKFLNNGERDLVLNIAMKNDKMTVTLTRV